MFLSKFSANINVGNNNNNANNENMIMFTPMNGRRSFTRIRRTVEQEWMDDQEIGNVKYLFQNDAFRESFMDSIRFYLKILQKGHSNSDESCRQKENLITKYAKKSILWKITIENILDGILIIHQNSS